jgi:excinuclease ABC subunit C
VEALGKKQLVTAGSHADTDVIGYAQTETMACFAVLHFSGGTLLDKDYELFSVPDDPENAVSSLLKQYYLLRGFAPKKILLPFSVADAELYSALLFQKFNRKSVFHVPQRGDNVKLVALANSNAMEEAQRVTDKEEKYSAILKMLRKMLAIETPVRIEAYDISNISGTDIVGGMVVFQDGKPKRSAYRYFKIEKLENPFISGSSG